MTQKYAIITSIAKVVSEDEQNKILEFTDGQQIKHNYPDIHAIILGIDEVNEIPKDLLTVMFDYHKVNVITRSDYNDDIINKAKELKDALKTEFVNLRRKYNV